MSRTGVIPYLTAADMEALAAQLHDPFTPEDYRTVLALSPGINRLLRARLEQASEVET